MGFLAYAFFLGGPEQHLIVKQQFPVSFLIRWLFASIPALLIGAIFILLFIFSNHRVGNNYNEIDIKKSAIVIFFIVVIPTFIGTLFFFFI